MATPRLLAFAGSIRRDSYNRKLVPIVAAGAEAAGARVTFLDLADYPLPLYNGDLETNEGLPAAARRLKTALIDHDGFLVAAPEYNSSITPLLKNAIDWASRREGDEPALAAYRGKFAGLVSASPGALGGLRGLFHLRQILGNIGVHVVPQQHAVSRAADAFDADGNLVDRAADEAVRGVGRAVADLLAKVLA